MKEITGNNLVLLKTFDTSVEAHMTKTLLESEGVVCCIFDENSVSLNPLHNVALGGVKVMIREKDGEKAMTILKESDDKPYTNDEGKAVTCPKCGSTKLYNGFHSLKRNPASIFVMILSFAFLVLPFYSKKVKHCKACGCEF